MIFGFLCGLIFGQLMYQSPNSDQVGLLGGSIVLKH